MSSAFKRQGSHCIALWLAALVAVVAFPAAAAAAPELSVDLTHTPASIPRNAEQLIYVAKVRNDATSSPSVGDILTCNGVPPEWGGTKEWNGKPVAKISFAYRWLRGGAPIPGQNGPIPKGDPRPTYTLAAEDAGEAIQCQVEGTIEATNPAESLTSVAVSQPSVVVNPEPSPPAPVATVKNSRSTVEVIGGGELVVGKQLKCNPPTDWANGPSWTFRWLRNGVQIAAGEEYTVAAADEHAVLQCAAAGETGTGGAPSGGTAIAVSSASSVTVVGGLPAGVESGIGVKGQVVNAPEIEFETSVNGEVRLEVELPSGGPETRVYRVTVAPDSQLWVCEASEPQGPTPALVSCVRSKPLGPQEEYSPVEIWASLGSETPDPAIAVARVSGGGSASADDTDVMVFGPATPFGITAFSTKVADSLGNDYTQAGGHPVNANGAFQLARRTNGEGSATQIEFLRDIVTDLPPGFLGNPRAVPQLCSGVQAVEEDQFASPACPRASIVGWADIVLGIVKSGSLLAGYPVYAIEPERGAPAQFVIYLNGPKTIISVVPRLRAADGYAIRLESPALAKNPTIFSVDLTLCGFGANVEEDSVKHGAAPAVTGCKSASQGGAEPAYAEPFLTNPTDCSTTPPVTRIAVDSWENRGATDADGGPVYSDPNWHVTEAVSPQVTGCDLVDFDPTMQLQPTTQRADTPTGLDVSLSVPTEGLETPTGIAQALLRKAVVRLPQGMAVNPAAADGLGACTQAQIGLGNSQPIECPESSKIGSAEATTPLLEEPLEGGIYLAKQGDNPFGSLLALYLVLENTERGVRIKLPGQVAADPVTGRLTTSFDDNPQAPVKELNLHFNAGNRAALLTPPKCGTYQIESELTPWSGDAEPTAGTRTLTSSFEVTSGPDGGPCPSGDLDAKLNAGLQNPLAASTSPFLTQITREDGSRRINGLDLTLPPGVTAYLKGIPYCPDAALAAVSSAVGTGQSQIDSPSCPAASEVGRVTVGAGGGSNPYYVDTGRVYLAGPYKGAPLSLAVVAPAVAGPFDLGSVVVRNAAYVDPETARITVKSDPIPTILHGIPLDLRDVRVEVDRPGFTLAPTNCEAMAVNATVGGEGGGSAQLSDRFQVGDCAGLAFKPKLSLRLKGAIKRAGNPKLVAKLTFPEGRNANAKRVSVALPRSEFLDQGHIRTICTRVQYAANACPAASVYGHAEATSPLLDYRLAGNVYLRSSSNELPDLVVALRGPAYQPLAVDLVGVIDSKNGGIRTTFHAAPDAPVSSFTLRMQGGKKGLLDNSRNICRHRNRATVRMEGHNGMTFKFRPSVKAQCGKKAKERDGGRKRHR